MLLMILESAVRAAILIALVWAGLKVLRVRNPHIELAIWSAVLIAALAMPGLMAASPLTVTAPAVITERLDLTSSEIPVVINTPSPTLDANSIPPETPAASPRQLSWQIAVAAAYVAVAGLLAMRLLLACVLVWRLRRHARAFVAPEAPDLAVRVTPALTSPVTVGTTILLPAAFATWPQDKRAAVLFHEGVHAARGDFYVHLLAGLHCALFWFSPLAWWLRKRLVELSEITSDDSAVKKLGNHTAYAEILLGMSRDAHSPPFGAAMAWRPTVLGRIHRLLDHYRPALPVSRRIRWAATAATFPVIGLVTGSLAAAAPQTLVLEQLTMPFKAQALTAAPLVIPAEPFVPRTVAVSTLPTTAEFAITSTAPPPKHDQVSPAPTLVAEAVSAVIPDAPKTAQTCVANVRKAVLIMIVDRHTVLIKMRGGPFKRVTVVNDPNGTPDQDIKEPYDICVGNQVEPLGLERGVSFVAAIEDIDEHEAQALRAARNARLLNTRERALPNVDLRGSSAAGRTASLCNDARLTLLQIGLCTEAMNGTKVADADSLEDFKHRVRATIKRRQALMNRQSNTFGPTNLTGPLNWGMTLPSSGPPYPQSAAPQR